MTEEGREFQLNSERDRDRVVASIRGQFQLCFGVSNMESLFQKNEHVRVIYTLRVFFHMLETCIRFIYNL